jgi:hypothetical protein
VHSFAINPYGIVNRGLLLAFWAPGGRPCGDGIAGEFRFAGRAASAFFPTMLEKPAFRGDIGDVGAGSESIGRGGFIFIGDMFEGAKGDEADGLAQAGGIELRRGDGGVQAQFPADFIGHPVADARADGLIEEKSFQGFFAMALQFFAQIGHGEFGILGLRRQVGPRVAEIVEHDAAEHTVVVENESGFLGPKDEVIVLRDGVGGGIDRELAGHAEVDLEMKCGGEGKEHALSVGLGAEEFFAIEDTERGRGAVAVDARFGVGVDGDDLFSMKGAPLAAGKFDLGEFGHDVKLIEMGGGSKGSWY